MEFVATQDTFGESGTPSELMTKYGLDKDAIIKKVLAVKKRI
jgi:transketolase